MLLCSHGVNTPYSRWSGFTASCANWVSEHHIQNCVSISWIDLMNVLMIHSSMFRFCNNRQLSSSSRRRPPSSTPSRAPRTPWPRPPSSSSARTLTPSPSGDPSTPQLMTSRLTFGLQDLQTSRVEAARCLRTCSSSCWRVSRMTRARRSRAPTSCTRPSLGSGLGWTQASPR